MWRISALDREGRQVASCEITSGELTIGRDADRQLILPSASVSRRHARVYFDNGQPCIFDEGSANGVIVDGVRITAPTFVHGGSRIDLADFRLVVEPLVPVESLPPPPRPPAATGPAPIRLIAEGGPYDGRVFEVSAAELAVGRAIDNDIVLDDPSLSRKHAKLHRGPGGEVEVEDLGSSNGTFVNGRKVGRGAVQPGDQVRFGELMFRAEGDIPLGGVTSDVSPGLPQKQLILLGGGAAVTFLLLLFMIVALVRKPKPISAPGKEAIARLTSQAHKHLLDGQTLYGDRKYNEAAEELKQARELDPGNAEVAHLLYLAERGQQDESTATSVLSYLQTSDRHSLETAVKKFYDIPAESPARGKVVDRLEPAFENAGSAMFTRAAWVDAAWTLCRAFELGHMTGKKPSDEALRKLREAEKKLRGGVPCKTTAP